MEQRKSNGKEDWRAAGSPRLSETVYGTYECDGGTSFYSYRMVYTQESIRVLDLRIVANAGVNIGHLQQLLGAIERAITIGAIINDEYSPPELRERLREGLND